MQDAFSQDMFNISDLNNPRYNGHVQTCGVKSVSGGMGGGAGSLSMGLAAGIVASGKKDRKGCTKGKIEAIMRNNAVRTKLVVPITVSGHVKKSASANTSAVTNHHHHHHHHQQQQQQQQQSPVVFVPNHQVHSSSLHGRQEVIRVKEEHDDPYTFTEPEPQSLSLYQAGGSTGAVKAKNIVVTSPGTAVQHHRSTNTMVTPDRSRHVDRSAGVKLIKSAHHQQLHSAVGNVTSAAAIAASHDQSRTGKAVSTVAQDVASRSPRTVTKRKLSSVALRGITGGTSFNSSNSNINNSSNINNHNQGQNQEQGGIRSQYQNYHYHSHHYYRRPQYSDRVCLPAKRQPRKSVWQRERNAKHELLERIHGVQSKLASYSRDLYPLGVEISDSESDEYEFERSAVYERHWFSRTDADIFLLDDNKSRGSRVPPATTVIDEDESPRERRVEFARAETRRRLAQTLAGLKSAGEPSAELVAAVIRAARVLPNATAILLGVNGAQSISSSTTKTNRGARFLTTGEKCTYSEGCQNQALPATRHCLRHIMYNVDQRLFSHCTGRLEDNTQCNRPTFDPSHVSPLCPLHTTQAQTTVVRTSSDSRHSRKKSRLLGMSRNSKRNNKKKKKTSSPLAMMHDLHHNNNHHYIHNNTSSQQNNSNNNRLSNSGQLTLSYSNSHNTNTTGNFLQESQNQQQHGMLQDEQDTDSRNTSAALVGRLQHSVGTDTASSPLSVSSSGAASQVNEHINSSSVVSTGVESIVGSAADSLLDSTLHHRHHQDIVEEVSEEVLAIEALDPVELANQTTRLLEEHDLNNVLNQISTDLAFNDLFIDKNGEYEPTREETEELERALEAVDNDVRSLERMTRSLPLPLPLLQLPLEGLLDTTAPPTSTTTGGGTVTTAPPPPGGGSSNNVGPTGGGKVTPSGVVVTGNGGGTTTQSGGVSTNNNNGTVTQPQSQPSSAGTTRVVISGGGNNVVSVTSGGETSSCNNNNSNSSSSSSSPSDTQLSGGVVTVAVPVGQQVNFVDTVVSTGVSSAPSFHHNGYVGSPIMSSPSVIAAGSTPNTTTPTNTSGPPPSSSSSSSSIVGAVVSTDNTSLHQPT